MNNSKFKLFILIIFVGQIFVFVLRFTSFSLIIGLLLNSIITFYYIKKANYKLFNPVVIGALLFYIAFNLPILYSGLVGFIDVDEFHSFLFNRFESLFTKSIWVLNIALTGFIIGTYHKRLIAPKRKQNELFVKKISFFEVFLLMFWFIFSGIIRYIFKLGAAGQAATISSYIGIWQHLLFTGNVILFSFYFIYSIEEKNKQKFVLVMISGLILISTQVLLGWKGSILSFSILCYLLYVLNDSPNKIFIQKKYIILLIILIPVMIFLADANRNLALTGQKSTSYATSPTQFIEKVFLRQQGLTRLMVVLDNNNNNFITNDFFITDLIQLNITPTKYIDHEYFGIDEAAKTSTGGSGPGSTFLMGGAVFTFLIFMIIGYIISHQYSKIKYNPNPIHIVIYSNTIIILSNLVAENFDIYIIKSFIVTIFFSYMWNYMTKFQYSWGKI